MSYQSTLGTEDSPELRKKTEKPPNNKERAEEDDDKQLRDECIATQQRIENLLVSAASAQLLTEKDVRDYMDAISLEKLEAGGAVDWKTKKKWLDQNLQDYAPRFLKDAQQKTNAFLENIATATRHGWITPASAERWYARLYERSSSWPETKRFLEQFNEKYLANWERLHRKKQELEKQKTALKVTGKEVPELAPIEAKGFDDLSYREKADIVHSALAALAMYKEKNDSLKSMYQTAQTMLQQATKTPRVLREDQAAEWLESLFNRGRSPDEVQKILSTTLPEYIGNWTKVRYRYDRLNRRMNSEGVPPGTRQLSEKEFLNLSYPEKENYVQEAEYVFDMVEQGPSNEPLDKMKLEIRGLLAQKDWEGAQDVINQAYKLAEGEDVYELKSMENTIRLATVGSGTEEAEAEPDLSAQEILRDMHDALREIDPSARDLYIKALNAGPQAFSSLCTMMFNRVWCKDNGYDIETQAPEPEDNTAENIDWNALDETEQTSAVQMTEWEPKVLRLNASDGSASGALVNGLREKVEARDYWYSLILKNVSYGKQREWVTSVNHRLKSGIRKLHSMGHSFSASSTST